MFLCLQIDYPDVQIMRPAQRGSAAASAHHHAGGGGGTQHVNNIDKILALDHEEGRMGRGRYHSDSSSEQVSDKRMF